MNGLQDLWAMEWFCFNMANCPVFYRHIEKCITFLLEDFMKIIITSWKISSKLVFSSFLYLLLIHCLLNSCVFFRILNDMVHATWRNLWISGKLSVDFISAESYGLKQRKVFEFYNPKKEVTVNFKLSLCFQNINNKHLFKIQNY